jgi:hypothetical protein
MSDQSVKLLSLKSPSEFLKFLDSLSKISESAIITVDREKVSSLVSSPDSTLILHASVDMESSFYDTLNIPDVKKLSRIIDTVDSALDLTINSNNIEYKGNGLKFKYHLFDEGFLTKPSLNLDKINAFEFDVEFDLTKDTLQRIYKGATFASETNKIYFQVEDGKLLVELTDKSRHNTDNFGLQLAEVDFDLKPTPINFDNVRLLTNVSDVFKVRINTEYGVVVFETEANGIKLKYIISSLTQ